MSVQQRSLGLMTVSMPRSEKVSTYSARLILVMLLGTPTWVAYIEMMRFSSSMSVRVTTASVEVIPSARRMSCRLPSALMMVALGSRAASSSQRAMSCSMILTVMPLERRRRAR